MGDFLPGYALTIHSYKFREIVKSRDKIIIMGFEDGKIYGMPNSVEELLQKVRDRKNQTRMICYIPSNFGKVPEVVSRELLRRNVNVLFPHIVEEHEPLMRSIF